MDIVLEEDREFYELLASGDDISAVIKAAVWIEREISKTLNQLFYDPKILETLDLTYFQRIGLLIASGFRDRFHSPLKALGKIRNRFAHDLIDQISKGDADNFYNSFAAEDKEIIQNTYKQIAKKYKRKEKYSSLPPRDKFTICIVTLRAAIFRAQQEIMEH